MESAIREYLGVLNEHIDIMGLGTEQRVWVMTCADHPLVNKTNGVNVNLKNGVHVHLPDVCCDRRKLIEIRQDAIDICRFFENASNDFDDIFDLAVYKVKNITKVSNSFKCYALYT